MNIWKILLSIVSAIALVTVSIWMGQQAYSWFPIEATLEAHLIDQLFSLLVVLGTFIFLGVTGTVLYSVVFHRPLANDTSDGPPIEGNITLEVVWTLIPILIVFWIAGYSYNIYDRMSIRGSMSSDPVAPVNEIIDVTAKQWAWVFHYPDKNITSTELHLPVNQRVRLALQSEDVLHGFYVPAFRVKQDIIPKETIDIEFTPVTEGTYQLTDSQFSGTYFATMAASVVVESPENYNRWLNQAAKQKPSPAKNQAVTEYRRNSSSPVKTGWETVKPAAPPIVNYSS